MSPHWLIVGLGNPGPKYATTRHNVGYLVAQVLVDRAAERFTKHKKGRADIADLRVGDAKVTVARPHTYMNETGAAVGPLAAFYGIPAAQVIAIHDELDLDFGGLRVKFGGGNNGHNGLRSIEKALGTADYYRVRVGIGRPTGRQDPAAYVLAPYSTAERKALPVYIEEAADAALSLIEHGLQVTQNGFNR